MNYFKIIGLAAVAVMALMPLAVPGASATTLEIGGVTQNKAVTIEGEATSPVFLAKTDGSAGNACSDSNFKMTTSVFTGTKVTGALSTLTFKRCSIESVVVDAAGQFYIEWTSGTSGNVYSENAKVTWPTAWGFSVTCETGSGTTLGKVTGVNSGHALLEVSAKLNCGFLLPSALFTADYTVTSAIGVVS
jgi:hypothetical protein